MLNKESDKKFIEVTHGGYEYGVKNYLIIVKICLLKLMLKKEIIC